MAQTRTITGLIGNAQCRPGVKLVARGGTMVVDTATDLATDLAVQSNATRRGIVGAFHAHQFGREWNRHCHRHPCTVSRFSQLAGMKINTKTGTTSAAAFTDRQV